MTDQSEMLAKIERLLLIQASAMADRAEEIRELQIEVDRLKRRLDRAGVASYCQACGAALGS